jgi:hypothetical protein
MGEGCRDALRLNSDRRLKLEFYGTEVTSDAGLLAYRELDKASGLTRTTGYEITDNGTGRSIRPALLPC